MMEFIQEIYNFLMSPWGGIAPSAFFGITAQLWAYRGLAINKGTNIEWDLRGYRLHRNAANRHAALF
jgi:hypothetical protein